MCLTKIAAYERICTTISDTWICVARAGLSESLGSNGEAQVDKRTWKMFPAWIYLLAVFYLYICLLSLFSSQFTPFSTPTLLLICHSHCLSNICKHTRTFKVYLAHCVLRLHYLSESSVSLVAHRQSAVLDPGRSHHHGRVSIYSWQHNFPTSDWDTLHVYSWQASTVTRYKKKHFNRGKEITRKIYLCIKYPKISQWIKTWHLWDIEWFKIIIHISACLRTQ